MQKHEQWAKNQEKRNGARSVSDGDSTRFDGQDSVGKERERQFAHIEGTTITPNEAKAFEGLLRLPRREKGEKQGPSSGGLKHSASVEDHDLATSKDTSHYSPALLRIADKAREGEEKQLAKRQAQTSQLRTREEYTALTSPSDAMKRAVQREIGEVTGEMKRANTDVEVWQILWERVLKRVKTLTQPAPKERKKAKKKKQEIVGLEDHSSETGTEAQVAYPSQEDGKTSADLALLTHTLPTHLQRTFNLLRSSYPRSPLSLAILPTLKSLGPQAFALGASTRLYNQHMSRVYDLYRDITGVAQILVEMDREVYGYNTATLELLTRILADDRKAMDAIQRRSAPPERRDFVVPEFADFNIKNDSGATTPIRFPASPHKLPDSWTGSHILWATERQRSAIKELEHWTKVVRTRLEDRAVKVERDFEAWREGRSEFESMEDEVRREEWRENSERLREKDEKREVEREREGWIEELLGEGGVEA